jgi:hypothetical protein
MRKTMTVFYYIILKAINGYKTMLKKNLSAAKYTDKVKQLGIKRTQIKKANEVKLYNIGLKIIAELEQHAAGSKRKKSVNFYCGEEDFLQYLRKLLNEYTIEEDKVVNAAQKSSCALVSAIQLINSSKEKLTDEVAQQIYHYSRIITKCGSLEQKRLFNNIISNDQPRHMCFFFRQLQNFVSYLDESRSRA